MGTGWSLRAVSPPAGTAAGVQDALNRIVAQMSQWDTGSDISRFNRAAPGQWQLLPAEFTTVLAAALDVAEESGGAFDPAIGALSELWGFGAAGSRETAPGEADIVAARVDAGRIEFDALGLRARRTGWAQLDFSGIAKGYGVDLAAEWLLARGARNFLIEVGGEFRGHGLKPDGQPWWIDLEVPPGVMMTPIRAALHELSVATSGDYRRWFAADGRRYSHSLDPRTGRPIENNVRSVTVLHPRCMLADAWATALTVLGPEEGIALADAHALAAHMVAGGEEHMSAAMRAMMD